MITRRSITRRPRGMTMIEAILATLIVSLMLVAAMRVAWASKLAQFKGAQRTQGRWLAQGLMSEIVTLAYESPTSPGAFGRESGESSTSSTNYDDIDDYNNYSESPPKDKNGTAISGMTGWTRSVVVQRIDPANPALTSLVETGARRITVTVKCGSIPVGTCVMLRTKAP